jgi:hypothetical protein
MAMVRVGVTIDDQTYEIDVDLGSRGASEVTAWVGGKPVQVVLPDSDDGTGQCFLIDNRPCEFDVDPSLRWIRTRGGMHRLQLRDLGNVRNRRHGRDGRIRASIPGIE